MTSSSSGSTSAMHWTGFFAAWLSASLVAGLFWSLWALIRTRRQLRDPRRGWTRRDSDRSHAREG